jgi:AcrR family transcriptional regulator
VESIDAPAKPLRADALRNRNKLVEVATQAFTDHGVDVTLEEIARRGGVGIGTLNRHIPTREDLVLAVYEQQIEQLRIDSVELPKRLAPPDALHEWMRSFVRYAAVKRGLVALLKSLMETRSDVFDRPREIIRTSAQSLIDTAVADGSIRGNVNAPELIRAIGGICMATDRPGDNETAQTLVDLVFDGLRYGAPKSS